MLKKISLLLVFLLLSAFWSGYSQDEQEENQPLTAEELQGLPEATLIEIILTYDSDLTQTQTDLNEIKSQWSDAEKQYNEDNQRLTERENAQEIRENLFGKSLELQEQEKKRNLLEKIIIGSGGAIVGAAIGGGIVILTLLTSDNFQLYFSQ